MRQEVAASAAAGRGGRRGRVDVEGGEAVLRVGGAEAGEGAAQHGRRSGRHLLRVGRRVDQAGLAAAAATGLQDGYTLSVSPFNEIMVNRQV